MVNTSGILAGITNTVLHFVALTVEPGLNVLADQDAVPKGCTINGFYHSNFFISEGGEVANEVPLVDWYFIKDPGGNMEALGFTANGLPTPGNTGVHENKRFIIHTEKGLAGGGDASLSGVPMIFKGVIAIPRHLKKFRINDKLTLVARSNFATKFCCQSIYKYYT